MTAKPALRGEMPQATAQALARVRDGKIGCVMGQLLLRRQVERRISVDKNFFLFFLPHPERGGKKEKYNAHGAHLFQIQFAVQDILLPAA
jgi:hypothetical protein